MLNFFSLLCLETQSIIEPAKVIIYDVSQDNKSFHISIASLVIAILAFVIPIIYKFFIHARINICYIEPTDKLKDEPSCIIKQDFTRENQLTVVREGPFNFYHCTIEKKSKLKAIENVIVTLEKIEYEGEEFLIHAPLFWMNHECYSENPNTRHITKYGPIFDLFKEDCKTHNISVDLPSQKDINPILSKFNSEKDHNKNITFKIIIDSTTIIKNNVWSISIRANNDINYSYGKKRFYDLEVKEG